MERFIAAWHSSAGVAFADAQSGARGLLSSGDMNTFHASSVVSLHDDDSKRPLSRDAGKEDMHGVAACRCAHGSGTEDTEFTEAS
jgi:hypothetical protein